MRVIALGVIALLAAFDPVSIRLDKYVLLSGGTLTIMCHVPPAPEARWLEIGVDDVPSRTLQLGANSSPFEPLVIKDIACGSRIAYCAIGTGTEKRPSAVAVAQFNVAGCER